ncbi:carbon storage regulator [Zooshikella ganghwensis]|uniref:Carbon storage regulator n=1 Tax=Zooshikella ganghwensis TaxID=202772 RepID=A0A4P9VIV3_9GAMM|nr:carbon storage regulator [Zooshikella ganghwensis]RDH41622.1 carbon storage regulator [Zooshikella ganghwensis]
MLELIVGVNKSVVIGHDVVITYIGCKLINSRKSFTFHASKNGNFYDLFSVRYGERQALFGVTMFVVRKTKSDIVCWQNATGQISIGFDAPKNIEINREEIYTKKYGKKVA